MLLSGFIESNALKHNIFQSRGKSRNVAVYVGGGAAVAGPKYFWDPGLYKLFCFLKTPRSNIPWMLGEWCGTASPNWGFMLVWSLMCVWFDLEINKLHLREMSALTGLIGVRYFLLKVGVNRSVGESRNWEPVSVWKGCMLTAFRRSDSCNALIQNCSYL